MSQLGVAAQAAAPNPHTPEITLMSTRFAATALVLLVLIVTVLAIAFLTSPTLGQS